MTTRQGASQAVLMTQDYTWASQRDSKEAKNLQPRVVKRIRVEYVEMPDLRLSPSQARRLWNLPDGSFLRRAVGSDRFEARV